FRDAIECPRREARVTPLPSRVRCHGSLSAAPNIMRLPFGVRRRFRASSARRSTTANATAFRVGLEIHGSPVAPDGNRSEASTRHHSHSMPSALTRYGGVQESPAARSAVRAASAILSSVAIDSTTQGQSSASVTARRRESSVAASLAHTRILSGRPTVVANATAGRSGWGPGSTPAPVSQRPPGRFTPYRNTAYRIWSTAHEPTPSRPGIQALLIIRPIRRIDTWTGRITNPLLSGITPATTRLKLPRAYQNHGLNVLKRAAMDWITGDC